MAVACAHSAALLVALQVSSAQSDFSSGSFAPPSTLDGYVPRQDLDVQSALIDFLGSSNIGGEPKKEIQVSPTASPGEKSGSSPFRKWVAPQRGVLIPGNLAQPLEIKAEEVALRPGARRRVLRAAPPAKTRESEQLSAPSQGVPAAPAVDIPVPPVVSPRVAPPTDSDTLPPLSRSQENLRNKVRRVLTHYYKRPLNTRDRSPWEVMHAMLAYEVHSKVLQGGPQGDPITAVGWLCFNQGCKRRSLMYVNDQGKIRVRVGPAMQGHRGQLLAMLAQAKVSREYPMRIDEQDFTIADLVHMEMETCYSRTELTFKLIGLIRYLDTSTTWMNNQGMEWSIPRLISEELRQPVRGAACGGTHRLAGLTVAYKTREQRGEPVDGEYLRAKNFVRRYQKYAYRLQNSDGSFSTEWFRGKGDEQDLDRNLKTTGHLLEWLLYAASERELQHWRTRKAANYLANILNNNRFKDWEAGPLGHAIHALLIYDRLVFQAHDSPETRPLFAKSKSRGSTSRQH
ncbi:MAG: hypothetical protein MK171_02570 [Pirellulales bacterium]|nr:hypothetical protein [Pirellulales bacterium]